MQFKNFNFPNSAPADDRHSLVRSKWTQVAAGASVMIGLALLASGIVPNPAPPAGESHWCYDPMNQKLVVKRSASSCEKSRTIPDPESITATGRPVLLQSLIQF